MKFGANKCVNMKILVQSILIVSIALIMRPQAKAQSDLMDLFGDDKAITEYEFATFKTTKVVYGHSVEATAKGNLVFLIQHNFGSLNSGVYELFGLDRATMRLGFEYGINDNLTAGIGRSTWEKTYDGFIKMKLLRQSSGARVMPITLSYVAGSSINSLNWPNPDRKNFFSSRMSYFHQLLIARKFNSNFSLQLSPTAIHKNLVPKRSDQNTSFALGVGGRYKLTQRIALNGEYFYFPESQTSLERTDVISLGLDIETGGHVFQLHISNANAMFERAFISETAGKWGKGDIYFGFNISRTFVIVKPKHSQH